MAVLKRNLTDLKASAARLQQNALFRNTLWMLFAQGIRLVLQAVYFVIIARALGPEQYGAFVGATSLIAILAPFASLGSAHLLVKNVSRNHALFSEYWGNALFMVLVSGTALIGLVLLVAPLILPREIPWLLILIAAITDLIFLRMLDTSGHAFQSVLRLNRTAQVNILPSVSRVIAAVVLIQFFPNPNALTWTWLYLASTAISSSLAVLMVRTSLGPPKLALWRIKPELLEGCYFSVGLSAQTIYNDIDKTMLARLAVLEATGLYAAAYRLIDVAFVPVRSLLAASYARFFQRGAAGIKGSLGVSQNPDATRRDLWPGCWGEFVSLCARHPPGFGRRICSDCPSLTLVSSHSFAEITALFCC